MPNDNLDTKELENILEKEEEFIDAVNNLENEIGLGVDLSVNESMKYRAPKQVIKKLEGTLKSNRDILAKTLTENIQLKHKLKTKVSLEEASSKNENVIVIINYDSKLYNLSCEKCEFVAKSKEVLMGHNKFIHLDCHVGRKHCDTVTELNAYIEH